jgi:hypothetical protein
VQAVVEDTSLLGESRLIQPLRDNGSRLRSRSAPDATQPTAHLAPGPFIQAQLERLHPSPIHFDDRLLLGAQVLEAGLGKITRDARKMRERRLDVGIGLLAASTQAAFHGQRKVFLA